MDISFSSTQLNNQKCSFGQWKRVVVNNFDNFIDRAYALRDIMEVNPKAKACFQIGKEAPFNVTNSIFALIDYIQPPVLDGAHRRLPNLSEKTINVYVNSKFHRKLFNALKQCLKATNAAEARKIANDATKPFRIKA